VEVAMVEFYSPISRKDLGFLCLGYPFEISNLLWLQILERNVKPEIRQIRAEI
jgi:hypothetical protein